VAPHLDAEREAMMMESAEACDVEGLAAFPGASRLLAQLAEHPWAIATSCKRGTACSRLEYLGLPCPRVLVTAEDVRNGKPSPEPYLLAAQRLGLEPSACVVVEDAPAGIVSARAAGARVIAVASSLPEADLGGADVIIRQLEDLRIEKVARGLAISF
jgi:sugar-phosphatase